MANHQVSADSLKEGSVVVLRGKVTYSRIRSAVTTVEEAQKLQSKSRHKIDPPFTRLALSHVSVIASGNGDPQDSFNVNGQVYSREEYFVYERLYQSKMHPEMEACYSLNSRGNILPQLFERNENGQFDQYLDTSIVGPNGQPAELAKDTEVIVVLNVFKSQNQENRGLGLQQVLVDGKMNLYTGQSSVNTATLSNLGINFASTPVPQPVATPQPPAQPQDNSTVMSNGMAMPAPTTQPMAPQQPAQPVAPQVQPLPQNTGAPQPMAPQAPQQPMANQVMPQAQAAAQMPQTPEQLYAEQQRNIAAQQANNSPWQG